MISTRHARSNNPSFPATYEASLIYLDANNLYGWAMSQSLPTHGFRFLQQEEISALKVATLVLNRPIYVGFTVLELSKLHIYDFHYNHMKLKYPRANQLRLLFTDTYSVAYAAQTDDIYKHGY